MLTKAFVQEVINPHLVRVRVPLFNKLEGVNGATPSKELARACVCSLPNFIVDIKVGDVVILGFEEDDSAKPIVLGHLSTNRYSESLVDAKVYNFEAKNITVLGEDTTIGKILPENLLSLLNQKENIANQFTAINKQVQEAVVRIDGTISTMQTSITNVSGQATTNANAIELINQQLTTINSTLAVLSSKLNTLDARCGEIEKKFNNYITKYPTVLDAKSYGTDISEVTSPQEGQIYLKLEEDA